MVSRRATTISRGVGEIRETQCPGSYMRAARVERMVTLFSPSAFRNGLQVEVDGVVSAVRCGNVRVRTDDGLPLGWFAALPPSSQYRMSARRPALRRQEMAGAAQ